VQTQAAADVLAGGEEDCSAHAAHACGPVPGAHGSHTPAPPVSPASHEDTHEPPGTSGPPSAPGSHVAAGEQKHAAMPAEAVCAVVACSAHLTQEKSPTPLL